MKSGEICMAIFVVGILGILIAACVVGSSQEDDRVKEAERTALMLEVARDIEAEQNGVAYKEFWKLTTKEKSWYAVTGDLVDNQFALISGKRLIIQETYTHELVKWDQIPKLLRRKCMRIYMPTDAPEIPEMEYGIRPVKSEVHVIGGQEYYGELTEFQKRLMVIDKRIIKLEDKRREEQAELE